MGKRGFCVSADLEQITAESYKYIHDPEEFKSPEMPEMEVFGIVVYVDWDGTDYVVSDEIIHMYGIGESLAGAVQDYKETVHEYYYLLKGDSITLGNYLKGQLDYLQEKRGGSSDGNGTQPIQNQNP